MSRVLLLSADVDMSDLAALLKQKAPHLTVHLAHDPHAHEAQVVVCWNPPLGSLGALKHLKLVHSIAAGVDHVHADPTLPDVPVCRVVDPDLKRGMAEYVLWGELHFFRDMDTVLAQQRRHHWSAPLQRTARRWSIGVMGLGELGAYVATTLAGLHFEVRGWARSAKQLAGVTTLSGPEQFPEFLAGLDCLVCLVPLTDDTRGILNATTFSQLSHGAVLINCARGAHLVKGDLLAALDSGQLRGALLDVFQVEPLPADDLLWNTPGVIVTPHMASSAADDVVVEQVVDNIRRLLEGKPLLNQVAAFGGY